MFVNQPMSSPHPALGARIRRARLAKGLSLQDLAERMDTPVTRAALSKYELGQITPSPSALRDLGCVLEVAPAYLLSTAEPDPVDITWLAYRKHSRLTKRDQDRIQSHAEHRVEPYAFLLRELHRDAKSRFPAPRRCTNDTDAEEHANELRKRWALGSGPIDRLVARVEDAGVLVIEGPGSDGFDALSGRTQAGVPVIALNVARPSDRVRFSLAHELGHLLLDTHGVTPKQEESLANRFAAALLVPARAARQELGPSRVRLSRVELEQLKLKYGVSMQLWTRRAKELGIISDATYRGLQIWFRSNGLHVRESVSYVGDESPQRLRLLAAQALAEDVVDREWLRHRGLRVEPTSDADSTDNVDSSAVALLRLPADERARRLEEQARNAAKDYEADAALVEWLEFDEQRPTDDEGSK